MIGASDNPCSTSVTTMTHIVMMMISARKGNGDPLASTRGRASADASDTIPRIAVQAIRKTGFQCGTDRASASRR